MVSTTRRQRRSVNLWPGFVDALSSLLMIIIFVLMIFGVAQYYLNNILQGQDKALNSLKNQINALSQTLGQEKRTAGRLQSQVNDLQKNKILLQKELKKSHEQQQESSLKLDAFQAEIKQLNDNLLRLNKALGASHETISQQKIEIDKLGFRLNEALTKQVEDLKRFRSEFFGLLRNTLGKRDDILIVGDRFVFQSEVLFSSGSATLGQEGKVQLRKLGKSLKDLMETFPEEIDWILRIDGHTDSRPIRTAQFQSNWMLSFARALSVVQFLIQEGIPEHRLAAAGFGEHQPIDSKKTLEALKRNRRIEMRLDQR